MGMPCACARCVLVRGRRARHVAHGTWQCIDPLARSLTHARILTLLQGLSVRDAFQVGRAALAGAAPSMFMPRPAEEAEKFLLIPEVSRVSEYVRA